jgi:hypothetical protein
LRPFLSGFAPNVIWYVVVHVHVWPSRDATCLQPIPLDRGYHRDCPHQCAL